MGMVPSKYRVSDSELQRLRAALVDLIAERGYAATSLMAVLDRAEVDRPTFEDHFGSLDVFCVEVWDEEVQQFSWRSPWTLSLAPPAGETECAQLPGPTSAT